MFGYIKYNNTIMELELNKIYRIKFIGTGSDIFPNLTNAVVKVTDVDDDSGVFREKYTLEILFGIVRKKYPGENIVIYGVEFGNYSTEEIEWNEDKE